MKTLSGAIIFLSLILGSSRASAQGIVHGHVLDSLTVEQLKGAEITLAGTTFNAVSNTNGEFRIAGVPPGEYMLHASYLGYIEKDCLIDVEQGQILKFDVELVPVIAVKGKTVLTRQGLDQVEEINQQISSNTIENVVAGNKLQDMPDENFPVTLSRLPGVSIMYNPVPLPLPFASGGIGTMSGLDYISPPLGDFTHPEDPVARILIRGLDSRYYNITINGIRIPPASDKVRTMDLNNMSGRDFQNIEVRKTITSDEDADATAGVINMVAEKAPCRRIISLKALGNYNKLDNSARQYSFIGSYGERFFDNMFGIRADAQMERKIMSNEFKNSSENFLYGTYSYTSGVRDRKDAAILLDLVTPDGGSITFYNVLNKTNTEDFKSEADSSLAFMNPQASFGDTKTEHELFLSSIAGRDYVFGFNVDWNAAFSESRHNHPYDYSLGFDGYVDFLTGASRNQYALNHALDVPTKNYSKEKTASLDFHRKYALGNEITGELKLGGKYRINSGSYLEDSHLVTVNSGYGISYFQDSPPGEHIGLGNYSIPLMNHDALRSWGQSTFSRYSSNKGPHINSYNFSQRVSAGYIMHTLSFRQLAIFITGLRIEGEHNAYSGYYFPGLITMSQTNPKPSQVILYNQLPQQTRTFHYNRTTILPNFQMILKPTDFMNLRLAAYKTLIRPSSSARMPKYFAISTGMTAYLTYLNIGNPDLKNADVWNYEFQTQFYGNDIGMFSINAFYKEIKGMVQATNGILLTDSNALKALGIDWSNYVGQFPRNAGGISSTFNLFSYFNSSKPTRIWGFEITHQANFRYLPGLLKNIVLNYNFTFLRSESWAKDASVIYTTGWKSVLTDEKQKLADAPDFLANVSLGYDINGFSFRVSYFYQDEYPVYDNSVDIYDQSDLTEIRRKRLSRLDIAIREQVLKHISFILQLNNITNFKEEALIKNPPTFGRPDQNWQTAQAFRYGMNFDFGVGIDL